MMLVGTVPTQVIVRGVRIELRCPRDRDRISIPRHLLWLIAATVLTLTACHGASVCFAPLCGTKGLEGWAFETGVAMITNNSIGEISLASMERETGASGGEVYSITASRTLGELRWNIEGHTLTPRFEIPMTLEIVNENAPNTFPDYSVSFAVRWVDFPWNDTIKTTFMMGIGLSYSERIYRVDKLRHPGENRSNLKFNWPIQLTLALPAYPQEQLTIFISHHSGGHIFDKGGINSIGMGFRHEF